MAMFSSASIQYDTQFWIPKCLKLVALNILNGNWKFTTTSNEQLNNSSNWKCSLKSLTSKFSSSFYFLCSPDRWSFFFCYSQNHINYFKSSSLWNLHVSPIEWNANDEFCILLLRFGICFQFLDSTNDVKLLKTKAKGIIHPSSWYAYLFRCQYMYQRNWAKQNKLTKISSPHVLPSRVVSSSPISVYKYTQLDELKAFSSKQALAQQQRERERWNENQWRRVYPWQT